MNHVPPAPAVACSLSQASLARRSARWQELASRALQQASRTPHGQQLTFSTSQEAADELEELAALERRCCPGHRGDRARRERPAAEPTFPAIHTRRRCLSASLPSTPGGYLVATSTVRPAAIRTQYQAALGAGRS
jgi:hypothetical protein